MDKICFFNEKTCLSCCWNLVPPLCLWMIAYMILLRIHKTWRRKWKKNISFFFCFSLSSGGSFLSHSPTFSSLQGVKAKLTQKLWNSVNANSEEGTDNAKRDNKVRHDFIKCNNYWTKCETAAKYFLFFESFALCRMYCKFCFKLRLAYTKIRQNATEEPQIYNMIV